MTIQLVCTTRQLPEHLRVTATERAVRHNPANRPSSVIVAHALGANQPKARIVVLTRKRWKMKEKSPLRLPRIANVAILVRPSRVTPNPSFKRTRLRHAAYFKR